MKITELGLPQEALDKIPHLVEKMRDLELPVPKKWYVQVLQYTRAAETKSKGGILIPGKTTDEDKHQGRSGLVLALGPLAYEEDRKNGHEPACKPGDWILWPAVENAATRIEYSPDVVLAFLNDDKVVATGVDPEMTVVG